MSELITEFAAPGFHRLKPSGLLVPYPSDPRLRAYRREGCPTLTRDGRVLSPIRGGAASSYIVYNSSLATTAAPVKQPTGTAIRTMMQLASASTQKLRFVEWGCSFDGFAAVLPGQVELFDNTAAATMSTAYAAADIQPYGDSNAPANTAGASGVPLNLSTTTSGFATAAVTEGTVAGYRAADLQMLPPTGPYVKQWPLGKEFDVPVSHFPRCRMTFGTTVNTYIYIIMEA